MNERRNVNKNSIEKYKGRDRLGERRIRFLKKMK
jgi:hypothetical protein